MTIKLHIRERCYNLHLSMENPPDRLPLATRKELVTTVGGLSIGFSGVALETAKAVPGNAKDIVIAAALAGFFVGLRPLLHIRDREIRRLEQQTDSLGSEQLRLF